MSSCNLLKEVITELQETATNYESSENIKEIQAVANKFKQAEEKILTAKIKDPSLSDFSKKLADIYGKYSQITTDYISAYQKKDGTKMNQYQQKINQLFQEQKAVIQEINNYCRSNN